MKAISLWQPWASLWCSPEKIHETRGWPTSHRGPLLVHAAKKVIHDLTPELAEIVDDVFGPHWGMELPRGALIGAVDIIACESTLGMSIDKDQQDDLICGDFSIGRYAWRRGEYKVFAKPIPYRGAQGMFAVPDVLVAAAMLKAEGRPKMTTETVKELTRSIAEATEEHDMIETRTLIREVVRSNPDGGSVRLTESVEVEIRCPGGLEDKPEGYAIAGEWRVLPLDSSARRLGKGGGA